MLVSEAALHGVRAFLRMLRQLQWGTFTLHPCLAAPHPALRTSVPQESGFILAIQRGDGSWWERGG